jgi:sugar lactone lactonase YvrE
MEFRAKTLAGGFAFPEGPRWHADRLWFSDQHDSKVYALDLDGTVSEEFEVPGRPSGMGWLPDQDLIVVSMQERRLYRRHGGDLQPYADLSAIHSFYSNDMVVDGQGRAYVGNIGFDFENGGAPASTAMALVGTDGAVSTAATDLMVPNGTVISADGRTLIVAESLANRLTAFDIGADGTLSGRRLFAALGDHVPDGICLDREGCIWFASCFVGAVFRVREGSEILDRVPVEKANPYACMLGGEDGCDLFICCAPHHEPKRTREMRGGRIDVARAPAAAAGRP